MDKSIKVCRGGKFRQRTRTNQLWNKRWNGKSIFIGDLSMTMGFPTILIFGGILLSKFICESLRLIAVTSGTIQPIDLCAVVSLRWRCRKRGFSKTVLCGCRRGLGLRLNRISRSQLEE